MINLPRCIRKVEFQLTRKFNKCIELLAGTLVKRKAKLESVSSRQRFNVINLF